MDIFISHVHDDETIASALKDFLEGLFLNADVFVSGRDLTGGELWFEKLRTRLERSTAIIAIVSRFSKDSNWIYFEAGAGFVRKCTIPLVVDGVTIDTLVPPLKLLQSRTFDDAGLRLLAQDIALLAGIRPPDKCPGLSEAIKVADEFLGLRSSEDPSGPLSEPTAYDQVFGERDANVSERHSALQERCKQAVSIAIQSTYATFEIPSPDEIQKLSFRDMVGLAEAVGVSIPFGLRLSLSLFIFPRVDDPLWKKMNTERKLRDIETELSEYEHSLAGVSD